MHLLHCHYEMYQEKKRIDHLLCWQPIRLQYLQNPLNLFWVHGVAGANPVTVGSMVHPEKGTSVLKGHTLTWTPRGNLESPINQ